MENFEKTFKIVEQTMNKYEEDMDALIRNFIRETLAKLSKYENVFVVDATLGTFGWFIDGREVQPDNFSTYRDEEGYEYPFSDLLLEVQMLWHKTKEAGYKWQGIEGA